jgi:NAD(P)-dependent dehydrogenase (short-subunit alcohol dehydrogenase family)
MTEHRGRVALVTGASRGIGEAVARRLSREGLRVALMGRDQGALDQLAAALSTSAFACDLTDQTAVAAQLARVERELGPVDVLVNNAGVAESAPLELTDDALIERTFAVNVWPVMRLCRALVPATEKALA